uniref:Secreted protein n=1 Tax=Syphacia muris TaxID=451379 RepID=A0A0N5ASN3_9BILA
MLQAVVNLLWLLIVASVLIAQESATNSDDICNPETIESIIASLEYIKSGQLFELIQSYAELIETIDDVAAKNLSASANEEYKSTRILTKEIRNVFNIISNLITLMSRGYENDTDQILESLAKQLATAMNSIDKVITPFEDFKVITSFKKDIIRVFETNTVLTDSDFRKKQQILMQKMMMQAPERFFETSSQYHQWIVSAFFTELLSDEVMRFMQTEEVMVSVLKNIMVFVNVIRDLPICDSFATICNSLSNSKFFEAFCILFGESNKCHEQALSVSETAEKIQKINDGLALFRLLFLCDYTTDIEGIVRICKQRADNSKMFFEKKAKYLEKSSNSNSLKKCLFQTVGDKYFAVFASEQTVWLNSSYLEEIKQHDNRAYAIGYLINQTVTILNASKSGDAKLDAFTAEVTS